MEDARPEEIDRLLADVNAGRTDALDRLTRAVYAQLRALADRHLRRRFGTGADALTWQPTVLVNETFLRLLKQRKRLDTHGHFFAIANTVMKRVLLDYARERQALKRGGGVPTIPFQEEIHAVVDPALGSDLDLEALFATIDRLAGLDARKADLARMRLLWGMSLAEMAEALEVSLATVERDWRFVRAWLRRELRPPG